MTRVTDFGGFQTQREFSANRWAQVARNAATTGAIVTGGTSGSSEEAGM
jgi:hypothetical protein